MKKTRPARTRAVVFDLDGTLIDSLPLVLRAFRHALEPYAEKPTMDLFARLGGPPAKVFHSLLGDGKHVPAALERLTAFNRDNDHLIRPFEGVPVVLEQIRALSVTMAVWTGRDRGTTLDLMRLHGLEGYFETVLCGDDLPSHKPDPEGLREILARLDVGPHEALMVGDADVDVLGAAACGVDAVLIRHGRDVEPAVQARAWRTVPTAHLAYDIVLERLGGGAGAAES